MQIENHMPAETAEKIAAANIQLQKNGAQPPIMGDASYFTGEVRVINPFQGTPPARLSGATVSFAPGARTAWHTHPLGQTLIITAGHGFVQKQGEPAQAIAAGDVVWIPPHIKHWHGAAPNAAMTHIAVAEALGGKTVTWLEQVSDAQYPPK